MVRKSPKELMAENADEWILATILRKRSGCCPKDTVHHRIIGINRRGNEVAVVKISPIFKDINNIPGNYPDYDYHAQERNLLRDEDFFSQLVKLGALRPDDKLVRKPRGAD